MSGLRHTISAIALGSFLTLAPIAAPAQTQSPAPWVDQFFSARKLCQTGHILESEQAYNTLLTTLKGINASPALLSHAYDELAVVLKVAGRFDEAEKNYLRAVDLMEREDGHKGDRVGMLLSHLGAFYVEAGQLSRAEQYLLDSRDLLFGIGSVPAFCRASLLQNLGALSLLRGKTEEAENYYRQGLSLLREHPEEDKVQLAIMLGNLAHVLTVEDRAKESSPLLDEADSIFASMPGQYLTSYYALLVIHAGNSRRLGDLKAAERSCDQALPMGEQLFGPVNPKFVSALDVCSAVFKAQHRGKEAKQLASRSAALKSDLAIHTNLGKTVDLASLSRQSAR